MPSVHLLTVQQWVPLYLPIANLFMEHLEEEAIQSAPFQPAVWTCYVDDTFVIWQHGEEELARFHQHLNQQSPSIQFTMEREKEGRIAFLDVLVSWDGDRLFTSLYRKPTHTDRYIPFHSHHHLRVLTGVMRGMHNRALQVYDDTSRPAEMQHLEEVFTANGLPEQLVKNTLSRLPRYIEEDNQPEERPTILYTQKLEKACAPLGVKTVFKPQRAMRQLLVQVKERIPPENQREVVYEVPCKDCELKYIGEVKRSLKTRMTEHKYAVCRGDERNGITVHVHQLQHSIDWESARVRMTARGYWNRRTLEATQIRSEHRTMNLDCGLHISPIWNPLRDAT